MTTKKTDKNPLTDEQIKASLEANDPSHTINATTTDKFGVKDDDALLEKHIVTEDGIKPAAEVKGTEEYKEARK